VDHHTDFPDSQSHRLGGLGVEDFLDGLDFDEVISRSERSALIAPAAVGDRRDGVRVRPRQCPAGFSGGKVVLVGKINLSQVFRPAQTYFPQFLIGEFEFPTDADAARDVAEQLIDKFLYLWLGLFDVQIASQQPDAAVYVVSHAAGRDDPSGFDVHCRDAADAESVSPVYVRHRQRGSDDSRKRSDVGDLIGCLLGANVGH